jgi:hypothetical protein
MVNVFELVPAAMVMLEGTWASVLLEVRLTVIPPLGAVPLRVTVPVLELPPVTELGDAVTVCKTAG